MKKRVAIPFAALSLFGCLSFNAAAVAYADTSGQAQTSSAASATLSEQQAISIATQLFPIPKNFTQQNVNLQSNWMGQDKSVYNIMWQGPMTPGKPSDGLNVTVDATTGQVLQYNHFNQQNSWSTGTSISASKAQSLADDWVKKLAPTQSANLVLQSDQNVPKGMGEYSFWYVRKVNGILAPFDSVRLSFSPDGQLNNYSLQWTDATFPDASGVLQPKDVESTYKRALGLHLQYQPVYGWPASDPKTALAYVPADNNNRFYGGSQPTQGPWVDATTGNLVGVDGQPQADTSAPSYNPIDPSGGKQLPAKLSQPLTDDQAEQAIRTTLGLSSDYIVSDKSHTYPGPIQSKLGKSIQFTFRNSSQDSMSAAIDTETGLIMNYNHYNHPVQPLAAPSISDAQAQQVAVEFIKKVLPNLTGAIALMPSSQPRPDNGPGPANVNFVLLVNGIPATNFNVTVDPSTNAVENYFMTPNVTGPFPSSDHVISLSSAQDAYLSAQPMQLQYVLPVSSTQPDPKTGQFNFQSQAKVVYAPLTGTSGYLDAVTGQWVRLPVPGSQGTAPTDIHGHYGEKEMLLLAQRGALPLKDGKANPDAKVTRAQFVSMLVKANAMYFGGPSPFGEFKDVPEDNPYYADIMQAVEQGWLPLSTNFYPDKPMTRADAANLLVSFLGWQTLATHSGLFSLPFKDAKSIPTNEKGDAAIASGFGIIPSVKGNFLPSQGMTVADTAIAVVHTFQTQTDNHKQQEQPADTSGTIES